MQTIDQDIQVGMPAPGHAEHFITVGQATVGDRQQHGFALFGQFEGHLGRAALPLFSPGKTQQPRWEKAGDMADVADAAA
ncbi:hypothetical protein D3C78_982920 [compost metagenome]